MQPTIENHRSPAVDAEIGSNDRLSLQAKAGPESELIRRSKGPKAVYRVERSPDSAVNVISTVQEL